MIVTKEQIKLIYLHWLLNMNTNGEPNVETVFKIHEDADLILSHIIRELSCDSSLKVDINALANKVHANIIKV